VLWSSLANLFPLWSWSWPQCPLVSPLAWWLQPEVVASSILDLGVKDGVVLPTKGRCPWGQPPLLPGDPGSLQNRPPLDRQGRLSACREHVGSLETPCLSSSHLPACSDPGIPRNRSFRSQARGCAPLGHWTFSERFCCTPPCRDRTESSRRSTSPRDRVEAIGCQLGPGWLFPRLVRVGRRTGAKPASTPIAQHLGA